MSKILGGMKQADHDALAAERAEVFPKLSASVTAGPPKGFLEVGCNDNGEVVINHGDLLPDENGIGHIVFSPEEARQLARLLLKHSDVAARDLVAINKARDAKIKRIVDVLCP